MEEKIQQEYQELVNLEAAGTLEEAQQSRLAILKALDGAEKTADKTKKDLETALAQKQHWRDKHDDLEKKFEPFKEKQVEQPKPVNEVDLAKKVKLLSNLSDEQIEFVSNYAKGINKPLEETLQIDAVKVAIEAMSKKVQDDKKVPEPNYSGATFNKKPISELSDKEIQENWEEVRDAAINEGRARNKK